MGREAQLISQPVVINSQLVIAKTQVEISPLIVPQLVAIFCAQESTNDPSVLSGSWF